MYGDRLFHRHLDDDEEAIQIIHKHWLLGVQFLFWPAVSFIAGWVLLYIIPFQMFFYMVSVWSVVALVWLLRNFYDYYLDAWIITDQGIIDVEWHGWFHRESTRMLYSDVQGISYEIQGVFGTVLRYGAISIEKISTGSVVSLDHVANPRAVERIILKNMENYLHAKNLTDARHVQDILANVVAREMQLGDFADEEEEYEDDYEEDEEELEEELEEEYDEVEK